MKAKVIDRDLGWRETMQRLREIKDGRVKVGVLADDKGGADHGGGVTVAEVAVFNEYGTKDIPARPAFRSTFDAKREELAADGKQLIDAVLAGKIEAPQALGQLGAKLAAEIKKTITVGAGVPPPNAPSTVDKKGSSRPLVDTGRLVNAISWLVVLGKARDE